MRAKLNSIRIKLILTYLLSAVLAGVCVFFVFMTVSIAFYYNYEDFLNWVNANVVVFLLAVMLVFIMLMSAFFLLLTKKSIKFIEKITQLVEQISEGNLGIQIFDERTDELGNLSKAVNKMSSELERLIAEEKRWEKSKDEMINNISHDLRTPLTSIIGYLQMIIECKQNDNEDYMMQYAHVAYSKCEQLKLLVDQLFEFTNVSSKEYKLDITKIDVAELVRQVVAGLMPILQEKNICCRIDFPDEKVYTSADGTLIARVFDNLISNAVKYSPNGGNIDVILRKEPFGAFVRVTNYGITIPEQNLPYIFDRFYRVDKSRSNSCAGVGLGLAIVKSIVEKHKGEIHVKSYDNKTVFEVRLNTNS